MIKATPEEVFALLRGWLDKKTRLRLVASLKSLSLASECTLILVSEEKLGVSLLGQRRGVCSVDLIDCDFFFGTEDVPPSERDKSGFAFDVGLSIVTAEGESLWLLEIKERP